MSYYSYENRGGFMSNVPVAVKMKDGIPGNTPENFAEIMETCFFPVGRTGVKVSGRTDKI